MSQSKQAGRKERRRNQTREVKMLRNNIRRGILPAFHLAKQKGSGDRLERDSKGKLTWRQVGTFQALMALPEVKDVPVESVSQDPAATPQGS